ncbi:MAG: ORF6N domain-containing protein [Bacteroidota bacterium]|nr:ORF6N domain-containing protein [Bacteroidota bacterium]
MSNLIPTEYKSQRILTTQQIAELYSTDAKIIRNNYLRNQDKYIPGIHFYVLEGEELQAFKATPQIDVPPNINVMYIWTERGAFRHAKSLNNDKAWEVYDQLVENYFKSKELKEYTEKLSPQTKLLLQLSESIAKAELEQQEIKQIAVRAQQAVEVIKDTIITQPDNWRKDINRMFNRIVEAIGSQQFQELRNESYQLLNSRAHVKIEERLRKLQQRAEASGMPKYKRDKLNRMDVIEADPKLKEIYAAIIKEYTVKYCTDDERKGA